MEQKNIYINSIGSINDSSKNTLTFYEKKYFGHLKKDLEKKVGVIITDDKDIYKFKNIILSKKPRELFIKILKILMNNLLRFIKIIKVLQS